MRVALVLAAAATLALAACERPAGNGAAPRAAEDTQAGATLAIAAAAGGECAGTWNGEAVIVEALADRASAHIEQVIMAAGGPAQMTEIPVVRVEAAPALGWPCVGPWLAALERGGVARGQLAADAGDPAALAFGFAIPGMPPPRAIVGVGGEGRFTWDGAAIDGAGLRQRLAAPGDLDMGPPAPNDGQPPTVVIPGEMLLAPADDATVATIREALRLMRDGGMEPNLRAAAPPAPEAAAR